MMASSVAAPCSSKLKVRQKRLRSASPHARLTRLPNGEWMISWVPPDSSKKRSMIRQSWVGSAPRAERARARYSTIWRAAASSSPSARISQSMARSIAAAPSRASAAMAVDAMVTALPDLAPAAFFARLAGAGAASSPASRRSISPRSRATPADSSSLRPGASPSQNGMLGAAPGRSDELSAGVARLRGEIERLLAGEEAAPAPARRAKKAAGAKSGSAVTIASTAIAADARDGAAAIERAIDWLMRALGLDDAAARQIVEYLAR